MNQPVNPRNTSDWKAQPKLVQMRTILDALRTAAARWRPLQDLRQPEKNTLPEFPLHTLPEDVRKWVLEVSQATQTPPDLAAMMALAAGSAAAGSRSRIAAREGRSEPTGLFAAVMMEGGARSAAVVEEAMRPLHEWEGGQPPSDRYYASEPPPRGEMEVLSRFLGDTTQRMLVESLVEHGATATFSSSGGFLRQLAGRNSISLREHIHILETGYDGHSLVVQRTAKKFKRIDRPAISGGLAIEPNILQDLAKKPKFPGHSLLSRILFALPANKVGQREIAPPPVSVAALSSFRSAIRNVLTTHCDQNMTLAPEAERRFRDWEAEIEPQLADGGPFAPIRDWVARLPGATLRIAAILHRFQQEPTTPVSDAVMSSAIEIGRYLIEHARAAFQKMGVLPPREEDDLPYLIRWLTERGERAITVRDIHQGVRKTLSVERITELMEDLAKRGYVRKDRDNPKGAGRPPSPRYEVNPALFGEEIPPPPSIFAPVTPAPPQKTEQEICEEKRQASDAYLEKFLAKYKGMARSLRRKKEKLAKRERWERRRRERENGRRGD